MEEGDFHDTEIPFWEIFLGCLDDYIIETIEIYNEISDEDIRRAVGKRNAPASRYTTYNGFGIELNIETRWTQRAYKIEPNSNIPDGAPYNYIINKMAGREDKDVEDEWWPAGCSAVAMAQIMAYYEWPNNPWPLISPPSLGIFYNLPEECFDNPYKNNQTTFFSSITYNWHGMKNYVDPLGNITQYPDAKDLPDEWDPKMHVGVLMLEIGDAVNMKYAKSGSGATRDAVCKGFARFGYNKPVRKPYTIERIMDSISERKPVFMSGSKTDKFNTGGGHYWIVNGFTYASYTTAGGQTAMDYFVHCIPGWGDHHVGWYLNGVFDMRRDKGPVNLSMRTPLSKKELNFKKNLEVYTGLYPNAAAVNIDEIEGLLPPEVGQSPMETITETDQYSGTVRWEKNTPGTSIYVPLDKLEIPEEYFNIDSDYRAIIILKHKQGYTFHGVPNNFFKVEGADYVGHNANTGIIYAFFPKTAITVTEQVIPGVTPPAIGALPVSSITETEQYTGSVVWKNSAGVQMAPGQTFAAGVQYTATITLSAKAPYKFQGVPANFFFVDGARFVNNIADFFVVNATFRIIVSKPYINLPAPAAGEKPVTEISTNGQYSTAVSWWPPIASGATFAYNTTYTATITMTEEIGYTFNGVPAGYFYIDGASSVSHTANSCAVIAVFPSFGYFAGGTGVPGDPYLISSKQHFKNMELFSSQHYKLETNIYLVYSGENWTPINTFYGVLDGNNKNIWFYEIEETVQGSYSGIFRENYGTIKDLIVQGSLKISENGIVAGMLVGLNAGIIDNVETYKSVQGHMIQSTYTSSHAGAIVGKNAVSGVITSCYNHGPILSPFNRTGIASVNEGLISSSKNHASIDPDRFASGSGYETDPYIISTAGHFNSIRFTDTSTETVYFKLANSIHLTNPGGNWNPINMFYGNLSGAYYTVSFDMIEENVPLWGHTGLFRENYGYIGGLNVAGKMIVPGGSLYAGLICGHNGGTIWQCQTDYFFRDYYDYMIINNNSSPSSYIGGITGVNTGIIDMVKNYGSIYSTGQKNQIAGFNLGTIYNDLGYGILVP